MSTINGTNNGSNIYELINQQNQTDTSTSKAAEDSEMFMKLMIAQLKNQDPTSPADTTDFMQQISSMSMVESINNLVTSVESMSSSMLSSQAALRASSMVGQTVFREGDSASIYENGYVRGMVSVESSMPNVTVEIYSKAGELVSSASLGSLEPGDHDFVWGGEGYPAGQYEIVAKSSSGGKTTEVPVLIGHTVNSVTLGQNGIGMKVNTDAGSFSIDEVRQIG